MSRTVNHSPVADSDYKTLKEYLRLLLRNSISKLRIQDPSTRGSRHLFII